MYDRELRVAEKEVEMGKLRLGGIKSEDKLAFYEQLLHTNTALLNDIAADIETKISYAIDLEEYATDDEEKFLTGKIKTNSVSLKEATEKQIR